MHNQGYKGDGYFLPQAAILYYDLVIVIMRFWSCLQDVRKVRNQWECVEQKKKKKEEYWQKLNTASEKMLKGEHVERML